MTDYADKVVVDCSTQQSYRVALTPEEIAIRDAMRAAGASQAAIEAAIASVHQSSETAIRSIPGWATWTEAKVISWIDSSTIPAGDTKTAIKAMARMCVALRNRTFPNLEAGQ